MSPSTLTREYCDCGAGSLLVEFDARRHAYRHNEWARGPLLAKSVVPEIESGILRVTPDSPIGERKLAYRAARVAAREHKWDFPTFPYPTRRPDLEGPDAFLYLKDRRAVGYLVADTSPEWIPADVRKPPRRFSDDRLWPRPADTEFREEPTGCVREVFVCSDLRRSGIGTALVRAALEAYGLQVGELAFGSPFTEAGLALAQRFAVNGLIRVGA